MVNDETSSPAFCASALIPEGVMSGVPMICSCASVSCTVLWAFQPIATAPIPKMISTAAAINPPYSNALRMICSFDPSLPLSGQCRCRCFAGHRRGRGDVVWTFPGLMSAVLRSSVSATWLRTQRAQGVQDHADVDRLLGQRTGDRRQEPDGGECHAAHGKADAGEDALAGDAHRALPDDNGVGHPGHPVDDDHGVRSL